MADHYIFPKGKNNPRYQMEYPHSLYQTGIYKTWCNMKSRCSNPKSTYYEGYGGRGIKVCNEWQTFAGFYKDMGKSYQPGLTIDRINNNGNYSSENCRWSTSRDQANHTRNTDRAKRYIFNNQSLTIKQWADKLGIKRTTLDMRIREYKWPLKLAFMKEVALYR